MERIVCAYWGEPDPPFHRVADRGADIVAVIVDVGQGYDLSAVRQRALTLGAVRAHVLDVREEFARDYLLRAMQAGAMFGGTRPMIAPLARPVVVRKLIEIAAIERTDVISSAAREDVENAGRHLQAIAHALDPGVRIVVPAAARDDVTSTTVSTLWGRSVRLSASAGPVPEDAFTLTRAPEGCPPDPATVEVSFERGVPVRVNGIDMPFVELIESLETIAGAHGVGRGTGAVARRGWREVFEAPAAVVLCAAHEALEARLLGDDLLRLKPQLAHAYAALIEEDNWFAPTRETIDAFVASAQSRVTGSVTLSLLRGHCRVSAVSAGPFDRETARGPSAVPLAQEPFA